MLPLFVAETNNGTTEFYSEKDIWSWNKVGNPDNTLDGKIFPAHAIAVTVNGSCCSAFYQPYHYTYSHDITSMYPQDGHVLSPPEGLFICTIEPDWSYMEDYIKSLPYGDRI